MHHLYTETVPLQFKLSLQKHFITLKPRQNGRHFADDTFKRIFLNENVRISINISLKFVPMGPINNIPALVQIMAWRRPGDRPLSFWKFAQSTILMNFQNSLTVELDIIMIMVDYHDERDFARFAFKMVIECISYILAALYIKLNHTCNIGRENQNIIHFQTHHDEVPIRFCQLSINIYHCRQLVLIYFLDLCIAVSVPLSQWRTCGPYDQRTAASWLTASSDVIGATKIPGW